MFSAGKISGIMAGCLGKPGWGKHPTLSAELDKEGTRAGGVDVEFVAEVLRVVGPVGGMEGMEEDFWGVRAGGS